MFQKNLKLACIRLEKNNFEQHYLVNIHEQVSEKMVGLR